MRRRVKVYPPLAEPKATRDNAPYFSHCGSLNFVGNNYHRLRSRASSETVKR